MKQEDKQLLLKDLCARLPYGLKIETEYFAKATLISIRKNISYGANKDLLVTYDISGEENPFKSDERIDIATKIKPYLFPLSSMTDELWDREFAECGITEFTRDSFKYGCETLEFNNSNPDLLNMVRFINKLIENHFDIYRLIPKGLAIDATGLNIY